MGLETSALRSEYIHRINKVLDYIESNISNELTVEQLASVANFSQFHFHRIFSALVGETISRYIRRKRLEKAADLLLFNINRPVVDIAYEIGFSSPAAFSRAFKDYFNMSASDWRRGGYIESGNFGKMNSNLGKQVSNFGKDKFDRSEYFCSVNFTDFSKFIWSVEMKEKNVKANVEIKEFPEMTVAYVRHTGPYAGDEKLFESLFTKLFTWAGPRGLIRFPETQTLSVYHDNPDITEEDKLRLSVCITVPPDTKVDGEIGKMTIPKGKYAVAHFEIDSSQYGDAWDMLMGGWFPESGYQPDDRPCFELYLNNPKEHPEGKHIVDICVPVKPL